MTVTITLTHDDLTRNTFIDVKYRGQLLWNAGFEHHPSTAMKRAKRIARLFKKVRIVRS